MLACVALGALIASTCQRLSRTIVGTSDLHGSAGWRFFFLVLSSRFLFSRLARWLVAVAFWSWLARRHVA